MQTTLKKETIDKIESSPLFMVSFERYGTHSNAQTKISITYHCPSYAYTVQAWVNITPIKYRQLSGYSNLCEILKPKNFSAIRTSKLTGEEVTNDNEQACKAVFELVCDAIAQSTDDKVYLDMYQTIKNKSKF